MTSAHLSLIKCRWAPFSCIFDLTLQAQLDGLCSRNSLLNLGIASCIMLFRQLGAILGAGVAIVAAGPLSYSVRDIPSRPDAVSKRTVPDTHVLHERQLPQWTSKWKRSAKVPRDALLPMRVGLKQRNLEDGALMLRDMSVIRLQGPK